MPDPGIAPALQVAFIGLQIQISNDSPLSMGQFSPPRAWRSSRQLRLDSLDDSFFTPRRCCIHGVEANIARRAYPKKSGPQLQ